MNRFRIIIAALALSAPLAACSEGAGYAKSYEMARSKAEKCATATQARDAYLKEQDDRNYTNWAITSDVECTELSMGLY